MNTKLLTTALVLGLGASAFAAESATLKHRYSFDPAGYDAEGRLTFEDSVGGKTGVCYGNAYIDDIYDPVTYEVIGSQMILSGDGNVASFTDGSFAALPANIMSGFSSFSIEMWVKCTGDRGNWMRLFDFGNCFTTTDDLTGEVLVNGGHNYTMMTWRSSSGTLRSGVRLYWDEDTQYREDVVDAPTLPIGDDVFHHIVYTYDSETQTGKIYSDGAIAGSGSQEFNPTQFGDMTNMWLGKPQFRDYYFQGNYDEFRIYQGVLSAAEVSNNYKLGANKLGDLGTLESIEITAPKNTIYKNEHLPLTVNATFSIAGVINVTGDCTFANTNPEVASITDGAVLGLAEGTAKITADYQDKSATFEVTVIDEAPTLELVHRYSFNGNANDSVGTANGTLENGATISGGKLVLTPSDSAAANGQYVSLPLQNYFDGQLAATIEVWAQIDNVNQDYNWCRLWQFSSSISSFYLTPRGSTVINSYIKTPYGDSELVGAGYAAGMEEGVMAHLVVVADGYNKKFSIYRDGNLLAEKSLDLVPADLGAFTLARIGADGANPGLVGKVDEMRMYNGAMTVEDVRLSYASGPDTLPSETGDLQSVYVKLANGTTTMTESTSSPFNVYADYTNVKGVILDPAETTVYSVDENIASVVNGKLYAYEVGTATLNITYQNFAGSSTITVTAMPEAVLTHRYSFTSDAADSVGGANGTLHGSAAIENGTVVLASGGTSGTVDPDDAISYVQLPENLISDHESITIESWVRIDALQMWARLYDFGGKENGSGNKYMFMAPYNGTTGGSSFTFVTAGQGAAEQQLCKGGYYLPTGEMVYVVMTLLGDANLARMYVNGTLIVEADDISNNPTKIGSMPYCYLGRSMYSADSVFTGAIDEFRTWKGVLTAKQIAANYVAGPDQVAGDLGDLQGIRVVPDTPASAPGLAATFTVYGDFANMKDVPINSVDGVKISIDNPAFTLLDNHSYTCATIAKATLIAAYSGFEATAAIETTEAPATLVHRYSFNGNTMDSVGNADGENWGLEIANGQLIMDGSTPVVLPEGVMSEVAGNAFTLETWIEINYETQGNWSSFNVSFFNPEYVDNEYNEFALGAQPNKGNKINSTWALVELNDGSYYKTETFAPKGLAGAGMTHVAISVDPESQVMRLFMNGRLENQVAMTVSADRLKKWMPKYVGYLGTSRSSIGLPGKMEEFRIWKGAMTVDQAAANYAGGANYIPDVTQVGTLILNVPEVVYVDAAVPTTAIVSWDVAPVDVTATTYKVTDAASLDLTSDNEDVLVIDGKKRLVGVAAGTANVTASYRGETVTKTISVLPEQVALLHRYSFDDGVKDSVGYADGFTYGSGASVADGQLVLDGSQNHAFAQVPAGIITGLKSMTWEVWFTPGEYIANWNRLLDFGCINTGGDGTGYVFASIYTGGANVRIATRTVGGGEQYYSVATPQAMRDMTGQKLHMAYVYAEDGTVTGYLNGQAVSTTGSNNRKLSDIIDDFNYIGRSMFLVDPAINLSVDEFRIWNGTLDAKAVAANYAAGPNEIPAGEDVLQSVTLSAPLTTVLTKEGSSVKVVAHYSQAGDVDVTSDVELTSSDESIATTYVGGYGERRFGGIAAGTATISATYEGVTGTLDVTVLPDTYILANRYSFDDGVKDSVGGADGTLYGDATVADGILHLTGKGDRASLTDGSFAALPANLMSKYASYTIETWARANTGNEYWGRVWDFGNTTGDGAVGSGREYTMLAWGSGIYSVKYNDTEKQISTGFPAAGTEDFTYIVYSYDSATQTGYLYVNGELRASGTQYGDPTTFKYGMPDMWIGKSNFQDPYFTGDFQEFRIWHGVINPLQIAADQKAGPDEIGEVVVLDKLDLEVAGTEVMLGSGIPYTVWGRSATAGDIDLTADAEITFDPEGIFEIANGALMAIDLGIADATASYAGLTSTVTLTVIPNEFTLAHRYSFEDGMTDSIGGADGTLYGEEKYGTKVADGILHLTGQGDTGSLTDGSFAALPADIMSSFGSYTIETWARANTGNAGWGRVWDFGNNDGTDRIGSGREYTMLAWGNGIYSVKYKGTEYQIKAAFPAAGEESFLHIVYTYDKAIQTGYLYQNGKLVGSAKQIGDPTIFEFGMPNMWLGKSNWPDPYFTGDYQEFRIYNGFLTADQVAENYEAGPDVIPGPVVGDELVWDIVDNTLILSWEKGSLEVAPTAEGPWTAINAASPYEVDLSGEGAYYRLAE